LSELDRVLDLAYLRRAVGTREISQCITYLPGLEALMCRSGLYIDEWVRVFYATVWDDPSHEFIQFRFESDTHRIFASEIRQLYGFPKTPVRLHSLCYGAADPPRCPHGGTQPPASHVAAIFHPLFDEGSRWSLRDMTHLAQALEAVMRKTLLPRVGFREALTHLQQWLLGALVSHTMFDVVDFLLCEIEDRVMDGCRARCQLPYAHHLSHNFERLIHHPQYVMTRDTHARAFGTYRPVALGTDEQHKVIEPIEQPRIEDLQDESVRDTE
jgi:hypothetical protein